MSCPQHSSDWDCAGCVKDKLKASQEEVERLRVEAEVYYEFYKKLADTCHKDMLHFSGLRLEDMSAYLIKRLDHIPDAGQKVQTASEEL
jgi:hypothetical protein